MFKKKAIKKMYSNARLTKGMYFKVNNGRFFCHGLGLVKYDGSNNLILFSRELDMCIKHLNYDSTSSDTGVIDTQDSEHSALVLFGTHHTIGLITIIPGLCYGLYMLCKKYEKF